LTIAAGTRFGAYDVAALIGAGGMGSVYRARDSALNRDVAIKVLPESVANNPERLARFTREAQTLASISHPNIAGVYGLVEADGIRALVMELATGEDLSHRIARGPIPVDETIALGIQIADAIAAAHEHGIIHRDLKPANIKVGPGGAIKVLDFGLAKALDPAPAAVPGASDSPTVTSPAITRAGVILGTAAYMSPEQSRGKPLDRRTDVWSFGCVLFEMLTGRRAFGGDEVTDTLAAIVRAEPEWAWLPVDTPPAVRRVLARCLQKSSRDRLPDIGAARLDLIDAGVELSGRVPAGVTWGSAPHDRGRPMRWSVAALVGVAGAVLGAAAVVALRPPTSALPPRVVRFAFPASPSVAPRGAGTGRHVLALSPRGTHLAYWANDQLYVRRLDRVGDDVPLHGTEHAREPFFSPDGEWVAFYADGELKRVSVEGGVAMTLGPIAITWGADWDIDGMIRYGLGDQGIWQLPGGGGASTRVLSVEPGELAHGPQLLPGGRWILFTLRRANVNSWDQAEIVAQSLDTGERRVLVEGGRDAKYVRSGHLVYGRNAALLAVPFDANGIRVTGAPVPLIEHVVDADVRTGAMQFSISGDGSLAYLSGRTGASSSLAWVTRDGKQQLLSAPSHAYGGPRVSPDGTRAVVDVERADDFDVMMYDFARNVLTPLASSPAREQFPLWTPDSRRVVFYADADGGGLFSKAADGTGSTERLTTSASMQLPSSWTADARTLLLHQTVRAPFSNIRSSDPSNVFTLSLDRGNVVMPILQTAIRMAQPILSRDSKWLAYTHAASASDGTNVYVQPFPRLEDGRWQVSSGEGSSPLWSPDGKWLYFVSRNQAIGVPVETNPTFRAGKPVVLFPMPPVYSSALASGWRLWDIAPDGQRFLLVIPGGVAQTEIVMVLNWIEELKRLVPVSSR
jgi:serine/threonine-protein kinase